jgi:ABC-2 type transport system ATP-binding protein
VIFAGGPKKLRIALKPLETLGITLDDVALRQPKLDEVFLALTGHAATTDDANDEPRANAA